MYRSASLKFTLITSILNFLYGITFGLVTLISALTMEAPDTTGGSAGENFGAGLGYGIGKAILLVFAILAAVYACAALIPMLMKIVQYKRGGGTVLSVLCMIFDLAFLAVNGILSIQLLTGNGDPLAYVLGATAALFAISSVINFVLNIKIIKE